MMKSQDFDQNALAVMIHGRPFIQTTSLGEWVGFRWGKVEVSVRTKGANFLDDIWQARLYNKTSVWKLDLDWSLEIMRKVNDALGRKIEAKKRDLSDAQKFYGRLIIKEMAKWTRSVLIGS